ncbi:MAG: NADH:ubiquinone oxidoreductase subunit NDUFA12 [Rickettsiales bacterium]|nr:NADH:ubiquinone oxidoreductase subunit NDUFA12 [Pseudomonadota bacterium]MDA0965476.1 NADH:ubiquinone oxidoreductase subunit NDUFA12 [Pseudomonadota bacterium]MDG4542800.1 NADH:ubiquinone oxidoreductase subunit NDUFA12 [Rickettsiales bacterium]MDG4544752.1 NADH:ubiquinone oxidoreductase subunit NDUFA12 [Rickettsiales bacterium]MDG4546874.1 NADH:ubiquinone oxidoreductase subunit NDUFA12 [Rickettsiales bacterium]
MTIATKIHTKLRGKLIGTDEFGNRYFEDKKTDYSGKKKRWVLYKGMAEPSKVPPSWHGWLHYTTDNIPDEQYKWQKPHTPNLTGTKNAYFPAGHESKGGVRNKVASDYEAWKPE